MKNLKKSILCMLMAVVMVMTAPASSIIPVQDVYAASVRLNKTSLNLYTKNMFQLTVLNTGMKAQWSSSKPNVASVSAGYVIARSAGKTKITAVVGRKKLYCNVTVKVRPGEEVRMDFKDCKVQVGKTTQLRLLNIVGLASWKSSNTRVATVDRSGNVTGKKNRFCDNHCYISRQKVHIKSDCCIKLNIRDISYQKKGASC
ncbi:MAG: Ig domain-containing protein [Blautia hansenii]